MKATAQHAPARSMPLAVWFGLSLITLGLVFVTDTMTPLGFAHGTLYIFPVFLAALTQRPRFVAGLAVAGTVLSGAGFLLSPPPLYEPLIGYALANRQLAVVAILATGWLGIAVLHNLAQVSTVQQELRRQLADTMPLIVWTADPDGTIDYYSQALDRLTGQANEGAALGERWIALLHPEDRAGTLAAWQASIDTGNPYEVEFRIRRREGSYCWHLTRATPIRDEQGTIVKWYGTATDIDDQKRLIEETHRLATRLKTTLESITDAFFTLDREGRFTFLNPQAERLLQRSRDELIGGFVLDAFPDAANSPFEVHCQAALTEQRSTHFEAFYGPLAAWFEVSVYPSDEGLAIYFRDITRRRATEAQLHLLQTAVSRLNDIVMITEAEPIDAPGPRIVFVNEAFERRTGYKRNEVLGKSPRILQGPQTQRGELDRIRAALLRRQPIRARLINYTRAGKTYWIELDIVPITDERGQHTHWVAVERDITERLALEAQLQQVQRLETVGQLTGGIAHDFNNLLTVILGNAELLTEELSSLPQLRALAEIISGAAQRGAALTQHLLAFARRQTLDPRAVDVNLLVDGMDQLLRRTLGAHIAIELVRAPNLWPALVDPVQLESALLNLCINARDAMPAGGRLSIETANVHLDQAYADQHLDVVPGHYVLLAVSDTGVGIDPEHLPHVFEPFFTTKDRGKGNGLGLSMVYGFVKQSRGQINLYSEPHQGTTVKLFLPRFSGEADVDPREPAELDRAGGNETILLVEDDELVRRFAEQQLASLGYHVLVAATGPEALAHLRARADIDLLFTDIVMPGGMSGRELAEAARTLRPGLKVLYTSGYTENAILNHGHLDPGVHLLSKPYRRAELARRVRTALSSTPPA